MVCTRTPHPGSDPGSGPGALKLTTLSAEDVIKAMITGRRDPEVLAPQPASPAPHPAGKKGQGDTWLREPSLAARQPRRTQSYDHSGTAARFHGTRHILLSSGEAPDESNQRAL
jgi:hypothetical protein